MGSTNPPASAPGLFLDWRPPTPIKKHMIPKVVDAASAVDVFQTQTTSLLSVGVVARVTFRMGVRRIHKASGQNIALFVLPARDCPIQ